MALVACFRVNRVLAYGALTLSPLNVAGCEERLFIVEDQGEAEPDNGCYDSKPHASSLAFPPTVIRDH